MAIQFTPTTIPLLISIVILLVVLFTAFRRRQVQAARSFIWLMLFVTEWTIFYLLETSSPNPETQIFWSNFQYIGIALVPVALLVFSLEYSRLSAWVTRRNLLLLGIVPAISILLIWTNGYHHLFWSATPSQQTDAGLVVEYVRGPGFWLHAAYSYTLLLLGSFLLVRQSLRGPSIFETQALVMILGALIPFFANVIYIFWLSPLTRLDPTPFALMISGVFYAWGLFRLGLFNLVPVAGEVVLEGLQDGVMVLDQSGRVVYINPAFVDYSGISGRDAIGTSAQDVLARWPELVDEFRDTTQANTQIAVQFGNDTTRRFELRIFPLYDRARRFGGRVFTLREITNPVGVRAVDLTSATARSKLMLMTTRANGEVVSVNSRFVGVLGYSRDEIIEKSSISMWESIEQRSSLLRQSRNEGFENMETSLVARDGSQVNMLMSAKSITVNNETYIFFAMREKR